MPGCRSPSTPSTACRSVSVCCADGEQAQPRRPTCAHVARDLARGQSANRHFVRLTVLRYGPRYKLGGRSKVRPLIGCRCERSQIRADLSAGRGSTAAPRAKRRLWAVSDCKDNLRVIIGQLQIDRSQSARRLLSVSEQRVHTQRRCDPYCRCSYVDDASWRRTGRSIGQLSHGQPAIALGVFAEAEARRRGSALQSASACQQRGGRMSLHADRMARWKDVRRAHLRSVMGRCCSCSRSARLVMYWADLQRDAKSEWCELRYVVQSVVLSVRDGSALDGRAFVNTLHDRSAAD